MPPKKLLQKGLKGKKGPSEAEKKVAARKAQKIKEAKAATRAANRQGVTPRGEDASFELQFDEPNPPEPLTANESLCLMEDLAIQACMIVVVEIRHPEVRENVEVGYCVSVVNGKDLCGVNYDEAMTVFRESAESRPLTIGFVSPSGNKTVTHVFEEPGSIGVLFNHRMQFLNSTLVSNQETLLSAPRSERKELKQQITRMEEVIATASAAFAAMETEGRRDQSAVEEVPLPEDLTGCHEEIMKLRERVKALEAENSQLKNDSAQFATVNGFWAGIPSAQEVIQAAKSRPKAPMPADYVPPALLASSARKYPWSPTSSANQETKEEEVEEAEEEGLSFGGFTIPGTSSKKSRKEQEGLEEEEEEEEEGISFGGFTIPGTAKKKDRSGGEEKGKATVFGGLF